MRNLALFAGAALLTSSAIADIVLQNKTMTIRLQDGACTVPGALASISPIYHNYFRNGEATVNGQHLQLCWSKTSPRGEEWTGQVFIMDADGESGMVDFSEFEVNKGV